MQSLQTYRNYLANIQVKIAEYAYQTTLKLQVHSCDVSKYKKNLKILRAVFKVLKRYDFPFEINPAIASANLGDAFFITTSVLLSSYITNPIGLNVFADTGLTDDVLITGYNNSTRTVYISEAFSVKPNTITLQNNRLNCIGTDEFYKATVLINKILGTHYAIEVNQDYTL